MTVNQSKKYGQQEQITVRNHNRSTALERSGYTFGFNYKYACIKFYQNTSICYEDIEEITSIKGHNGRIDTQTVRKV